MSQKNNKNKTSNVNVPNYTNEQKQEMRKKMEEVKRQKRRYQIVIGILAVISMIEMIAQAYSSYTPSFFAKYLALGFGMFSVGGIALMLPITANLGNKFQEGKGDNLLVIIAFVLFLAGLIAIVYSFLNF